MSRLSHVRRASQWRLMRHRVDELAARMRKGGQHLHLGPRGAEMAARLDGPEQRNHGARHRIRDRRQRLGREAEQPAICPSRRG